MRSTSAASAVAALWLAACESAPAPRPASEPAAGSDLMGLEEDPPLAVGPTAPAPRNPPAAPTLPAEVSTQGSTERGPAPVGLVQAANDALRRGQYEVAIQTARQALRRDERYVPAMVALAKGYYHLRKYDLAGAILDIAAGIDEGVAEIHYLRGFLALAQAAQPAAMASFRRATEIEAKHGSAHNALGALFVQAKNYGEAVPALEKAVALVPASAGAQLNLGSAYRGAGDYVKAEAAYRKALEMRRGYPEAHFNLGILYLDAPQFPGLDTIGRLNAAIEQFTRYKERQSYRLAKDDPVDGYLEEARKGIERERKRLDRERKRATGASPPASSDTKGRR